MLTRGPQSKFVTKIITSPTGDRFQAIFLVTRIGDRVFGKMISIQAMSAGALTGAVENTSDSSNIGFLPSFSNFKNSTEEVVTFFSPIVSPYTDFSFFMSQPTRAPSLVI